MTYIESIAINSDLECTESNVTPSRFNGCRTALAELNSRMRSLQIMIIEFLYILPPSFRWNVFHSSNLISIIYRNYSTDKWIN
jgi:hypothetical protein